MGRGLGNLAVGVVYLHQIGVPGIATDMEVIVAELLASGFTKDVS